MPTILRSWLNLVTARPPTPTRHSLACLSPPHTRNRTRSLPQSSTLGVLLPPRCPPALPRPRRSTSAPLVVAASQRVAILLAIPGSTLANATMRARSLGARHAARGRTTYSNSEWKNFVQLGIRHDGEVQAPARREGRSACAEHRSASDVRVEWTSSRGQGSLEMSLCSHRSSPSCVPRSYTRTPEGPCTWVASRHCTGHGAAFNRSATPRLLILIYRFLQLQDSLVSWITENHRFGKQGVSGDEQGQAR